MKSKHLISILVALQLFRVGSGFTQNAPVVSIQDVSSTGSSVVMSVRASNFNGIRGCNLQIIYDPKVALATAFTRGPLLGGTLSANLLTPGVISLAWFTSPGCSLPDDEAIFEIGFRKVAPGATSVGWNNEYPLRSWVYENYYHLNDNPPESFYLPGTLSFLFGEPCLTLFLEGLYDKNLGQMRKSQDFLTDQFIDKFPENIVDVVALELRSSSDFSQVLLSLQDIPLLADGTIGINQDLQLAGDFYVVVTHRNHLRVISAHPVKTIEGRLHYNFSSGSEQVLGECMKQLDAGLWAVAGGDINQNGLVDQEDLESSHRGFRATLRGYLPEDVNGDGLVDLADRELINNNFLLGLAVKIPHDFPGLNFLIHKP